MEALTYLSIIVDSKYVGELSKISCISNEPLIEWRNSKAVGTSRCRSICIKTGFYIKLFCLFHCVNVFNNLYLNYDLKA